MEEIYRDEIFGEMKYKHRWYKKDKIIIFGKKWKIILAVKAYSGKDITEEQKKSYSYYIENENLVIRLIEEKLIEYYNECFQSIAENWSDAHEVNSADDFFNIVCPKTLLIKQDGSMYLLLDCVWDEEHGIAVQVLPDVVVGSQDLFL